MLYNKFGLEGVLSHMGTTCNLAALGCVNAKQMLNCIHYYSTKQEHKMAIRTYEKWINGQHYTHLETDEKGEI